MLLDLLYDSDFIIGYIRSSFKALIYSASTAATWSIGQIIPIQIQLDFMK